MEMIEKKRNRILCDIIEIHFLSPAEFIFSPSVMDRGDVVINDSVNMFERQ